MGSASPQSKLGSTFKASLQCLGKKAGGERVTGLGSACPPQPGSPLSPALFCGILRKDTSSGNPPRRTPDSPTTLYPEALMCPSDN